MSSVSPDLEQPNLSHKALPAHATPDSGQPKGGKTRTIVVVLIILACIAFAVWRIHSNNQETAAANARGLGTPATPIQAAPVVQKTMPIYLTALGSVTAYNTVTIKTRVDGQLLSVNFNEGQTVHKGDLLLQIDPRPYQAAVDQAEGQLAKDQANAANARAEAERYTALYTAGVVSKESQQSQLSTSGQAEGSIKADEAAIEAAKVNLAYTRITSPIDGVVGLRQVDPGNIVHASDSTGLILITQIHPIAVIFTIPEDQLPQVLQANHGKKLVVEAWDRSNSTKIAEGTLLTLDNTIDQTTGTVKLKAVFENKDGSLFPNQFVNIRLILKQQTDSIVIPSAAVQNGAQGNYIFVVHQGPEPQNLIDAYNAAGGAGGSGRGGGRRGGGASAAAGQAGGPGRAAGGRGGQNGPNDYVTTQNINVQVTEGTDVIVASGLQPGEQVVIDGEEKLKNGAPVTISKTVVGPSVLDSANGSVTGSNNIAPTTDSSGAAGSGTGTGNSTGSSYGNGQNGNQPNGNGQHRHRNGQNGNQNGSGGSGQTQ